MQSELGATALLKTVWWDLHLASLLTHLFFFVRLQPSVLRRCWLGSRKGIRPQYGGMAEVGTG